MTRLALSLFAVLMLSSATFAQDTLRVMSYNLLYYGNSNDLCGTDCKDTQLKVVMDYTRPDILAIQELRTLTQYADRILNQVMNADGGTNYARVDLLEGSSSITNMVFYDKNKLEYYDYDFLNTAPRRTQIYKFYRKNALQLAQGDTAFLAIAVVHLKAGDSNSDETSRNNQVVAIMNYFANNPEIDNALLVGDFNMDSSSEAAYQSMISPTGGSFAFNDPINEPGNWTANSAFKDIHTQSTRTDNVGGGSGGGSDDRFDFVMMSDDIKNAASKVAYVPGSYTSVGQDGSFYNGSVTSSSAVSTAVAAALYNISDHLPVYADFSFDVTVVGRTEAQAIAGLRIFGTQVTDELLFTLGTAPASDLSYRVMDYTGRQLMAGTVPAGTREMNLAATDLAKGLYILTVSDRNGNAQSRRFIKS